MLYTWDVDNRSSKGAKMGRLLLLIIGFVAGWFLKDSNWEEWLESLKAAFTPQETQEKPIPLLEEEEEATLADEVFANNLESLKGIGAVSNGKLNENGIYTFAQVAALTPEKLKEIVGGRVNAEAVIEEAKALAS